MAARTNPQSKARRRASQRLMEVMKQYDLDPKQVARETGLDRVTLKNLTKFTPCWHTIYKISAYLESVARERKQIKADQRTSSSP